MVNEQLPIACRYVAYDQWFITHIDPTWKIRYLKQRIISKCLNLPFDPRLSRNARPPSPITFAPTIPPPDSPIKVVTSSSDTGSDHQESTGDGYEEDDEEWEDFDGKADVKPKPSYFRQQKQEKQPQITTHTYTLIRFSTSQILEEDCQISWYDIQPHELVELHPSFLPPTFASSLVSPISIPSPPPDIAALPQPKSAQKKKKASPTTAKDQRDLPIPSLVSLPRHTPKLYIQPHWQGWVRALRVASRTHTTPAGDEPPLPVFGDNDGGGREDRKQRDKIEWRETWVVIHDGVINVCRSPNDTNPMRLPLSSLMALRGPECLPHSKNGTTKPRTKPRSPEPSTASSMTSEDLLSHSQEAMESIHDRESKRSTRNLKKPRKDGLLSTTSSPSLRTPGQDSQPRRMSSYSSTPTIYSSKSRDKDNTFIPTSKEEAEQVGMKVICVKFRVHSATAGKGDKAVGQDSAYPKTRRYTSTGPSLALAAGGTKVKAKTSTGPRVVVDSDVYLSDQPQGILMGPSRTSATPVGADSVTTSPILHPSGFNWNLFGGDKERKTTERRKAVNDDHGLLSPTVAAEDFEAPAAVNSLGWKSTSVSPPKHQQGTASRSQELDDEEGHAVIIPERTNVVTSSSPMTARPTVVIPIRTHSLATTNPTPATISPQSQPEYQISNPAYNNRDSDTSSSISVSSPIFAHSTVGSDLEDETFVRYGSGGGATSAMSGMSGTNRPRKGYRYGGYHVQAQLKKGKNEGESERQMSGDRGGAGKTAEGEVESKSGDCGQPQQAMREEKQRNKGTEREGWIALDMVNDHAFNSILRILHRHSPSSLFSSFTHSHTTAKPPTSFQSNISNKTTTNAVEGLHHIVKDQRAPSDTDDDDRYAAAAKNPANSNRAVHPPILESLAARTTPNHPTQPLAYVALPYPEWRLELVNQARRAGMREIGRPLDLALHGWGREFEERAAAAHDRKLKRDKELEREKKNKRKSAQSHVSTIKERGRKVDTAAGDDEDDEDDDRKEEEGIGATHLDSDSEEESDTEWLAWMTDLPRQFLVQQSQLAVQISQSPDSVFSNPFSSSSLVEGGDDGVKPPRTQEEERLLHADRIRNLEPSSTIQIVHSSNPVSPTSASFFDSLKQLPTLSSPSSFESLNPQRGSSSQILSPFPGTSSTDDLLVNRAANSKSQPRSLQRLRSRRNVGSVPEESGDYYEQAPLSSSPNHQLHHSVSMDRHLSSTKNRIDGHRQTDSIASINNEFVLGKPILTSEQIMQIESEVFTGPANQPSHWTFPPVPVLVPSTPSSSPSTSRPSAPVSTNVSGEVKASSSISAINRFTTSDLTRWSTSLGNSLPTLSSPSVSISPNSTSPPRSSVFGSLGRSPSLLSKVGGQEKEKMGFLKKRLSRDLTKDKEKEKDRDTGERATSPAGASPKQRPKLLVSSLSGSTSPVSPMLLPLPNHPTSGHHLHHSTSLISSSARALRHVHSGSSLRGEERSTTPPAGLGVILPETEGKEVQKKKKGRIDRIISGFDSSLAFAEGR